MKKTNKQVNKKLKEGYENRIKKISNFCAALIIICLFLGIWIGYDEGINNNSVNLFYGNLETISQNCNSTLIVKCFSEDDWCVLSFYYDDKYHDESSLMYDQVSLKNCLQNEMVYENEKPKNVTTL